LASRGFSGRVTFQNDDYLAELLMRGGQLLAATLGGPSPAPDRGGQDALDALTALPPASWVCHVEPLEPSLLTALAGLGAEPEVCNLNTVAGLRALLRDLAQRGENGVLELVASPPGHPHWARAVLADGRLLGSYSDSAPRLEASLEPLGGLLSRPMQPIRWFPAAASPLTIPPAVAAVAGPVEAIERQVIWIVSRFEGDWVRARERAAPVYALQESLLQMLESLLALAGAVESQADDSAGLEAALDRPVEVTPRSLAELDPRLQGLGPAQTCPILAEMVADALQRIVLPFPEPNLTECCRQAALALQSELRAVLPPPPANAPHNGGTTA
jgi:hypothetical protein